MVQFAPNPDFEQASGDRLVKYGLFNIIDELAGGNILEWDRVSDLQNSTVLMKYAMMGDRSIIEKRMYEIQKSKNRNG